MSCVPVSFNLLHLREGAHILRGGGRRGRPKPVLSVSLHPFDLFHRRISSHHTAVLASTGLPLPSPVSHYGISVSISGHIYAADVIFAYQRDGLDDHRHLELLLLPPDTSDIDVLPSGITGIICCWISPKSRYATTLSKASVS